MVRRRKTVVMGGTTGKTNHTFTHTHTTEGTIETSFESEGELGDGITETVVCNPRAVAGFQESHRWDLDDACMPVGQVSKATFYYTNNNTVDVTLTADWGDGPTDLSSEVYIAIMGGPTGKTNHTFTHTHTTEGTIVTSFLSEGELGDGVNSTRVCNPTAGPTASPITAGPTSASSNVIFSRNVVAFGAIAFSYLSIKLYI